MFLTEHIRIIYYLIISINGVIITAFLLAALIKKPSLLIFSFFCFFFLSIFHNASVFLSEYIKLNNEFPVSLQEFWIFSRSVNWVRLIFIVFFIHSVYKFRIAPIANVIFSLLIAAVIVSSLFVYTLFPYLLGVGIVLYAFFYLLFVFLRLPRLQMSASRQGLVRALFIFTCIFLFGIVLDLLKWIPVLLIPLSILLIDFSPVYIICVGVVMAVFATRISFLPSQGDENLKGTSPSSYLHDTSQLSKYPVTPREREIIELILHGETNRVIAEKLFISESTVKKHINNVFRKLGITNRWGLLKLFPQENTTKVP